MLREQSPAASTAPPHSNTPPTAHSTTSLPPFPPLPPAAPPAFPPPCRSNYGGTTVQLAAPGTNILSTWYTRNAYWGYEYYAEETGTSMSAPFVSGAAALAMAASKGKLTNAQVANLLIATSRQLPKLRGRVVANGVINLERVVQAALKAAGRN